VAAAHLQLVVSGSATNSAICNMHKVKNIYRIHEKSRGAHLIDCRVIQYNMTECVCDIVCLVFNGTFSTNRLYHATKVGKYIT